MTASIVARTSSGYGSPSRTIRSGRLWAVNSTGTSARSSSGNRCRASSTRAASPATRPGCVAHDRTADNGNSPPPTSVRASASLSRYVPTVMAENCGARQIATTRAGANSTTSAQASAMNGCQCRRPTKTRTGRRASSLTASSRVMSSTGERPPVARYRSRISSTSSGEVGRPPRRSRR